MGPAVEKEKDKKKKSAFKSVAAVTKSWGNKLTPKLEMEMKKVKSKVALMKVKQVIRFYIKCYFLKVYKLICLLVFQFSWPENFLSSF